MISVTYHKLAVLELEEAIAHYESRRKGFGLDLLQSVNAALERVVLFPKSCQIHPGTAFRKLVIRRFPYSVIYLEEAESIWVVAFAHQRRKPGYWLDRLPEDN